MFPFFFCHSFHSSSDIRAHIYTNWLDLDIRNSEKNIIHKIHSSSIRKKGWKISSNLFSNGICVFFQCFRISNNFFSYFFLLACLIRLIVNGNCMFFFTLFYRRRPMKEGVIRRNRRRWMMEEVLKSLKRKQHKKEIQSRNLLRWQKKGWKMAFNLEKLYVDDDFEVLRDSEKEKLSTGCIYKLFN